LRIASYIDLQHTECTCLGGW